MTSFWQFLHSAPSALFFVDMAKLGSNIPPLFKDPLPFFDRRSPTCDGTPSPC